jgi:hypothetical protein
MAKLLPAKNVVTEPATPLTVVAFATSTWIVAGTGAVVVVVEDLPECPLDGLEP